jgi:hypothetical protein
MYRRQEKSDPEIASNSGVCIFKYEEKYKTTTSYVNPKSWLLT